MTSRASTSPAASSLGAALLWCCVLAPAVTCQCTTGLRPGSPHVGATGRINAGVLWDPDGAGPASLHLVLGGTFDLIGGADSVGVAALDLTTGLWTGFDWPLFNAANCLLAEPGGGLVAGGGLTMASGIQRFDGNTWNPLAWGVDGTVFALARLPGGDLVVGGSFTSASGVPAANIASWNGANWSPLAAGLPGTVRDLAVLPNGDLLAAGAFSGPGGTPLASIMRWDGATWSPLGTGFEFSGGGAAPVDVLAVLPNGDLVAGGSFGVVGGLVAKGVARWNGTAWAPLGAGLTFYSATGVCSCLEVLGNGDLFVGGTFDRVGPMVVNHAAIWNGAGWTALGTGLGPTDTWQTKVQCAVELPGGDLVVGGSFDTAGGRRVLSIARWTGGTWLPIQPAFDGVLLAAAEAAGGDLIVAGGFRQTPDGAADYVARWNGTTWSPVAPGLTGGVQSLLVRPNGDLVVGGVWPLGVLGSAPVARWDGVSWTALGPMSLTFVRVPAIAEVANLGITIGLSSLLQNGLVTDAVQSWNGSAWLPVGTGLAGNTRALLALSNGELIAAGAFTAFGGIVRWDGTTWTSPGAVVAQALPTLLQLANGDVLLGGSFTSVGGVAANNVARWDGIAWHALGAGTDGLVRGLAQLPNGDVLATGSFTVAGGAPAQGVARWDGTTWTGFGGHSAASFQAVFVRPAGDALLAGLTTRGGYLSTGIERLVSTCPAAAVAYGAGCTGSGGPNALMATALPWENGTFRSRATGMPAFGVALSLLGFGQLSIPLASLLPQGGVGCSLLTGLDRLDLLSLHAGVAETAITVVPSPSLVGLTVYHQIGAVELDPQLNILALTSTNGLALTIGTY